MSTHTIRAVIFSRDLNFLSLLKDKAPLSDIGISVSNTGDPEDFLNLLLIKLPDLIVFDVDATPPDLVHKVDRIINGTEVRLVLIYTTAPTNLSKQMAGDRIRLLRKPIQLNDYRNTVVDLIELIEQGLSPIEDQLSFASVLNAGPDTGIIGASAQMRCVNEFIVTAARSHYPVVIHGETGTEVEDVARAIHMLKHGNKDSFRVIYCASLPDHLQERHIFANTKGQTTNSVTTDTVYLHNVHEMPLALQGRLMRLLKSTRVSVEQSTNLLIPRFIASLDTPPEQLIAQGILRSDVYHMLNVHSVTIPPLRERKEDIIPLMKNRLLRHFKGKIQMPQIEDEAAQLLTSYPWPGNTLELENFVARVLLGSDRAVLKAQDLPDEISSFSDKPPTEVPSGTSKALKDRPVPLDVFEDRTERNYIMGALTAFGDNKETASARLGISLATLYRKLPSLSQLHDNSVQDTDRISPENIVALKDYMQHQKTVYIAHVLDLAQNDKMKAAKILGVSLATLYREFERCPDRSGIG